MGKGAHPWSNGEREVLMFSTNSSFVIALAGLVVLAIAYRGISALREYERFVVFTLGRFTGVKGPGLVFVVPLLQSAVRVDLRVRVLSVPVQDVISRDNVSVKVSAVVYYRVSRPDEAIIQVEDFEEATSQLAQTTLRSVLGEHDLDAMLAERKQISDNIQSILDEHYHSWGINVLNVEIKNVDLAENMIRAIARQAEAERNRRAKVIDAEGELQAADRLRQAGEILAAWPQAMQLRSLLTLQHIAGDKASTIVFPLELAGALGLGRGKAASAG
jgi:regulator of protease activity HflC (stomatin/prohibitin superfamily)